MDAEELRRRRREKLLKRGAQLDAPTAEVHQHHEEPASRLEEEKETAEQPIIEITQP